MKPNNPNRFRGRSKRRGFALVITLSLMVLLTVIAVGLLTMSAISLRASGAGDARAEAEANARLALLLAIGELQTSMGPDQRVSARAHSIDQGTSEPNLMGAWTSWHWKPGTSGPNYTQKSDNFRRWLASMDPDAAKSGDSASPAFKDPVWLINPDTVGNPGGGDNVGPGLRGDRLGVQLSPTKKGAFAWAVMDESQKAPIQLRDPESEEDAEKPTNGELMARRIAPPRPKPEDIVESLDPEGLGNPAKIVSLESAVVAVGKEKGQSILSYQADVTPYSIGLLSNVADGGLKTDLTTLFESSSASANVNGQPTLYFTANDGAPRWDYIRNHYQLHRKLGKTATGGAPKLTLTPTDLRPAAIGVVASPATERLMPVIAKLQIMFSAVTHYNHLPERIAFYDKYGVPQGNTNYAAPHLVYDPVVTLYNPYDVSLTLQKLRVRVWDPPVLFGMKKNSDWLRPEFASGQFHSLARFQIANEHVPNARRYFTLLLTDAKAPAGYGGPITLQPGEVRVFAPFVEPNWNWQMETAGGYTVRSFFDWNAGNDFGNVDGRSKNPFGIETVPGWDPRAGLQTDHLSYGDARPQQTRYGFEIAAHPPDYPNGMNGGWLVINTRESFTIEAKPGRAVNIAGQPDFEVDLLAGSVADVTRDMLRTYRFRFSNPEAEISATPARPIISRNWLAGDILQKPGDQAASGKSPFGLLTMTAKTTVDNLDASTPWLHNQPVVEGMEQNTARVGNALDSYDVRFEEVQDFTGTGGGIEFDPGTKKGFYGASKTALKGVSNIPMFRVPLLPAASLGDLVTANLVAGAGLPRVTHPLGNSHAHPLLPSGAVSRSLNGGVTTGLMLDHSYLLNDALWDSTYFSTVANFTENPLVRGMSRGSLLTEFFEGKTKLLNGRFIPLASGQGSLQQQAEELDKLDDDLLSRRMASALAIQGPFNVNSDSVGAWKAMLASLRDNQLLGWGMADRSPKDKTGFSRFGLPIYGDGKGSDSEAFALKGQKRWAGFRALENDEIERLATAIVTEIRARAAEDGAPSLTLGEFVNRRLGSSGGIQVIEGILQKAISDSGINDEANGLDSKKLTSVVANNPAALTGLVTPEARSGYSSKTGYSGEGAPSMLTQGDLLMALAPVITVRGDTFRIRAYGDCRNPDGEVVAKAWCEAIVQRVPEYLDSSDNPELKPEQLQEEANRRFGRRLDIISFRWLSPEEV